jgi:nitroimidazol reductase NimA-like FMN-containing flavoprotein (pyridoxamine 5'-phosphate oxidase superfamily)
MRRVDRAVEDEAWIRSFLEQADFGVLAMADEGQPFVNSNLFAYDEAHHRLYLHTAETGRTRTTVERNARVCFHVARMGRLLPADTAMEFSVEYASVTVFGSGVVVSDREEAVFGLQLLLDKYFPHLRPGRDYQPIVDAELAHTTVIRVDVDAWTGKQKTAAEDFPGALWYGGRGGEALER